MKLSINGASQRVKSERLSIFELLEIEKVQSPEMVSVQLNGKVIDRSLYKDVSLTEGDEIEFLYFMGGGSSR